MHRRMAKRGLAVVWGCACWMGLAQAGALLDEADIVAAPGVAPASEFSFTATTAQALTVTLTDDQEPAPFQSLQIAVTLGDTLVGSASIGSTHKVTVSVPAAAGNYEFHVVGTPTNLGFGTFGSFSVCTAPQATPTACIAAESYSDNIQAPSTASTSGQSTLNTNFTTTLAGTYLVTLTDDAFPAPLQAAVAGIAQGSTPIAGPITPSATPTPVTLAGGTNYSLLVAATASSTLLAGLYSIQIVDPAGTPVFTRTLPVGELASSTVVSNPAAQTLSLSLTDLDYPSTLGGLGVAVTAGTQTLAKLTAPGKSSLAAPAGNLEIWQYAVAGSQPGAYALSLASSAANLLAVTQVVNPANAAAATSFAFAATLPAAGTYNLSVKDFQFPATLQTLAPTIAQNGAVLATNSSGNFNAAAGPIIVLVSATAAPGNSGIFGVTVATTASSPAVILDQTQAVGGTFSSRTMDVAASGQYSVALADLGFPGAFADLAVVVSSGGKEIGERLGSGNFQISVTPGQYVLSVVATAGTQNYGLYGIDVSSSPPTLTFTTSTGSVAAGQSIQLSWSSTNATACTAGGTSGWSGSEPLTGSGVAVVISTATTLTLTCTGPGGSVTQSLAVMTTPLTTASGGGGGSLDAAWLGMLATLLAARRLRTRVRMHMASGDRPVPGKAAKATCR